MKVRIYTKNGKVGLDAPSTLLRLMDEFLGLPQCFPTRRLSPPSGRFGGGGGADSNGG